MSTEDSEEAIYLDKVQPRLSRLAFICTRRFSRSRLGFAIVLVCKSAQSICLSIHLYAYMSVCLVVCLSLSLCRFTCIR